MAMALALALAKKKHDVVAAGQKPRRGIRMTVLLLALLALACYVGLFLSRMGGHEQQPQSKPRLPSAQGSSW
jgi:hypothetical protein